MGKAARTPSPPPLPPDPDGGPETIPIADEPRKPFSLDVLGAADFARKEYRMQWGIRRVFVLGQPIVFGAPKKGLKTTTAMDMAASIATGTPFLNHADFDVPEPLATLFLSGESGGFVLKDTVRRICESKGISDWPSALEGRFFIGFNLPQLSSSEQIAALVAEIVRHSIKVVMIDPLYLCLLGTAADGRHVDPANLFDMGPLFQQVTRACLDAGATPILIHHFKLTGVVAGPMPELENLAYSGIQEFARQWILLGRRERFSPGSGLHKLWLTVGGSAGHSGEWGVDVEEGRMGDDFSGRTWSVSVRPASEVTAESKGESIEAKAVRLMEANRVRDDAKAKLLETDAETALQWLRRKGQATKAGWRDALHWDSRRIGSIIAYLEERGRIQAARIAIAAGAGTREVDGWIVAAEPGVVPMVGGLS